MSNFYFPTELSMEILLKLPVKSLVRFTSVCKSWQSLITSPIFISSHLSTTENHVILERCDNHDRPKLYSLLKVTENGLDSFSELEFPFKSKFPCYGIVGSCHGLVCLWDDWQHVIIWNPSVKNHVVIPKPVFNPGKPPMFVLGFGVSDHVYKVVRLAYYTGPESYFLTVPPVADIFSLRTGSWRRVEAFHVRLKIFELMPRQVFLKGVVHWLASERTVDGHRRSSILTFEVGDEMFGEVMLPDELARILLRKLSVFMMGESLGVGVIEAGNRCDVWMMNEYGVKESWTELYTIDFGYQLYKVVGFCTSGEALCIVQGHELVVYIPKTRQTKNLGICGCPMSFYTDNYMESLLLLRGCSSGATKDSSSPLNIDN